MNCRQNNESENELNIVSMQKSQRASQHGT